MDNFTPLELSLRLQKEVPFRLIDVREKEEWDFCHLEKAELIPLSEFPSRSLAELKKDESIILYCHHGVRSERAGQFLLKNGYNHVSHLAGGIEAWALEVDSSVKRY
jgi:rhodanese-related sulfurtransferase